MEEKRSPLAIVGPIVGVLILYLVLSTAMNQFSQDSERLREEFIVELISEEEAGDKESSEAEEDSEASRSE
ncbi:hypothetical protein KFU94_58130 [Chloroflexi bacterium TSY]|nr:hypothetical protein [Chloroflexi bacterium TSY]